VASPPRDPEQDAVTERRRRISLATVTGVSLNDDFGNAASDVLATLRGRRGGRVLRWFRRRRTPAWVGVQEGKREDYAEDLPDDVWVTQDMTNEATQGVAVRAEPLSAVADTTDDAVAAHEEDGSIAGEQEQPDTP
jgi:hypothetical protein